MNDDLSVTAEDRRILRDLAKRVRDIADLPVMDERRRLWKRHNSLRPVRPMILVFPEGSWRELLTDADMRCEGERARRIEWNLRCRLYYHENLRDDTVIEGHYTVHTVTHSTGWGLSPRHIDSTEERGAWAFDPVVHKPEDLKKLHHPEITRDDEATRRELELHRDLLGDILEVRRKGVDHVSFHPMSQYCRLRGLGEVMMDMAADPDFVHEAMRILTDGHRRRVEQYVELDLLDLNNDGTYHSSGGVGYTDELPQDDFDGETVRPCDMWASAESQEMAQVSPDMHAEFVMAYEGELLEPFGLNGYGCCEPLTGGKLEHVFELPNMRRISISPFADVEEAAEKLKGDYIYSWKPHPAHLCGEFNPERIRRYIRHALETADAHGCVFEMVLKDTHTCDQRPERFTRWTEIAREEVRRISGVEEGELRGAELESLG